MKVVFTGPAFDNSGHSIVRSDLIKVCSVKGIIVQGSVKPDTEMVVASRLDTRKATSAASQGKNVTTYPSFIATFLGGVEIKAGPRPNNYTDAAVTDMLVPDFTAGYEALDK